MNSMNEWTVPRKNNIEMTIYNIYIYIHVKYFLRVPHTPIETPPLHIVSLAGPCPDSRGTGQQLANTCLGLFG